MDITRTIQGEEDPNWVEEFFDGTVKGNHSGWFPLPGRPQDVDKGDRLYLIYRGRIHGRFVITDVEDVDAQVKVGSAGPVIQARARVYVRCPGERAPRWIKRRGNQGIRYDDVPEWES
jgi:hypothetical protein